MRKNAQKPISMVFLIFVVSMIAIIVIYATSPKTNDEEIKSTTEDVLITEKANTNERYEQDYAYIKSDVVKTGDENSYRVPKTRKEFNLLLDELKNIPVKNMKGMQTAINKILAHKDYPENLIVITTEENESNLNVERCFPVAQFNIASGKIHIDKSKLNSLNNKQIISILVHEIEHFDNIARICKVMNSYEFIKILKTYNVVNIDEPFWARASYYANTINFDGIVYKNAFIKYLKENQGNTTSSYADFYRLTENIKNPIELNAYRQSDYVQRYYNVARMDTPIKIISRKFNEVDWEIYNFINTDEILWRERTSVFDYLYGKAIIYKYPKYKDYYEKCIKNKKGDMTTFWANYERTYDDFYKERNISTTTLKSIVNILGETKKEVVKRDITAEEISEALEYRTRTLLSNISHPSNISSIKKTAMSYLKYIKGKNISNTKTELDFILTLICIENNLTKQKIESIKLSELRIPNEIMTVYGVDSKDKLYSVIYENKEFQNIQNKLVLQNEEMLIQLLNSYRLNIKIG